jgi:hypothetical protein
MEEKCNKESDVHMLTEDVWERQIWQSTVVCILQPMVQVLFQHMDNSFTCKALPEISQCIWSTP